jgi:hypothetical protein
LPSPHEECMVAQPSGTVDRWTDFAANKFFNPRCWIAGRHAETRRPVALVNAGVCCVSSPARSPR